MEARPCSSSSAEHRCSRVPAMTHDRPLAGRSVVVTRAAEQAGPFVTSLRNLGAAVVEVPVIRIAAPDDGGASLLSSVRDLASYDWVVLTSPNAAERFLRAVDESAIGHADLKIACVGPGTASVVRDGGRSVALVADRAVGEGLVESFPLGSGRVLLPCAAVARSVVPDGLRARGWTVDEVVAYRTEPIPADPVRRSAVGEADAIAFTSSSTVRAFVSSLGTDALPPIVVSIGPETTATLIEHGVRPFRTADPHTLDGLLRALVESLK